MTSEPAGYERPIFNWADLAVVAFLSALIYCVVTVAHQWTGPL